MARRKDGRVGHTIVSARGLVATREVCLAKKLPGLAGSVASLFRSTLGATMLVPHRGITSIEGEELLMSAFLDYCSSMENNDLICVCNSGKSMPGMQVSK